MASGCKEQIIRRKEIIKKDEGKNVTKQRSEIESER
jgi:hypothetical protein